MSGLFSRNWAFIDPASQATLARTSLFIAGTGLGSVIALLAARTGFKKFILADGDIVEESNLNRQAFFREHLGKNKAFCTARLIYSINPDCEIEIVDTFLSGQQFRNYTERSDITVNTIDWENHAMVDCSIAARQSRRPVIFPMNIGWGSVIYLIPPAYPDDAPFADCFFKKSLSPLEIKRKLILDAVARQFPEYLQKLLPSFNAGSEQWNIDPQLGAASFLTASLSVRMAASICLGEAVPWLPDFVHFDPAHLV